MTAVKGFHARDDQFAVTCWCERAIVYVAAGVIGDDTKSCGRPGCERPVKR